MEKEVPNAATYASQQVERGWKGNPAPAPQTGDIIEHAVENLVPLGWRGDSRVEWLREKVTAALDVTRPVFDAVFKEEGGINSLETLFDKHFSCICFWLYTRTVKVTTKVPVFVEHTPEELAKRKQAAAAAAEAAEDAVPAAQRPAETQAPPVDGPVSEEENGYWETQDVVSTIQNQVVCATTGKLANEALNRAIVYFINIFPQLGKLDFDKMQKNLEFGVLPSGPTLSALEQLLFTFSCQFLLERVSTLGLSFGARK